MMDSSSSLTLVIQLLLDHLYLLGCFALRPTLQTLALIKCICMLQRQNATSGILQLYFVITAEEENAEWYSVESF